MFDVMHYNPKLIYKKITEIPIADALSRDCDDQIKLDDEKEILEVMVTLAMSKTAKDELIEVTAKDEELQLLIKYIQQEFPEEKEDLPPNIRHYCNSSPQSKSMPFQV